MCDPIVFSANLVKLLLVGGKSAKEHGPAQIIEMEHLQSPDLLLISPCHLWPMCKARFIFLQQTYANITFLCHRNVRTAITELLGGLVILAEELLTPSAVFKAAGM